MIRFLFLLFAAFLVTTLAHAGALVHQSTSTKVTLLTAPCLDQHKIDTLAERTRAPIFEAITIFHGRQIKACWTLLKAEGDKQAVLLLDDDRDGGVLPFEEFKFDAGA